MKLADEFGYEERAIHAYFGTFGQLFDNFDGSISTPVGANRLRAMVEENSTAGVVSQEIFDFHSNLWVPFNEKSWFEIPTTYTYIEKPKCIKMELNYFLRSIGLNKHKFVWATDVGLVPNMYVKIRSSTNQNFRGRFSVVPWLPRLDQIGQIDDVTFYKADRDYFVKEVEHN